MGFKRNSDLSEIEKVLNENRRKTDVLKHSVVEPSRSGKTVLKSKKVKEIMKSFNFTMKPSVREKLNKLVSYDAEFDADSASSYISEFIEKRYSELELDDLN